MFRWREYLWTARVLPFGKVQGLRDTSVAESMRAYSEAGLLPQATDHEIQALPREALCRAVKVAEERPRLRPPGPAPTPPKYSTTTALRSPRAPLRTWPRLDTPSRPGRGAYERAT